MCLCHNNRSPTKLLQLRAVIKAAGGVSRWAEKLIDAYKRARALGFNAGTSIGLAREEAIAVSGSELREIILTITGVGGVIDNCFED